MTKEDAKDKLCPFMMRSGSIIIYCYAAECMAWQGDRCAWIPEKKQQFDPFMRGTGKEIQQ